MTDQRTAADAPEAISTAAGGRGRAPVTAADVTAAVAYCGDTLRAGLGGDWTRPAGPLSWDCQYTLVHVCSDFIAYAGQVAGCPDDAYLPIDIHQEPDATVPGLLHAMTASGTVLAAVVATAPADGTGYHPYGNSDPEGFAAMGIVEVLVHTYDIAAGLGLGPCDPPRGVCERVLARLFPEAPGDTDPWQAMLWCTGRTGLPGHARRESWRWHGEPLGARA